MPGPDDAPPPRSSKPAGATRGLSPDPECPGQWYCTRHFNWEGDALCVTCAGTSEEADAAKTS